MRITQAGLRSGLPTPRFAAPSGRRPESYLGLRRRHAPQISSHPAAYARVPLVGALHAAARGASGTSGARADDSSARTRRTAILRRSDAVTWSQPTDGHAHPPRPRSAAPWRG